MFRCASCGGEHPGPPRAYSVRLAPHGWEITQDPSSRRWGELGEEQAVIHGPDGAEAWFLRGNVEIPVLDGGAPLALTVWVQVGEAAFDRAVEVWADPRRVADPPRRGTLTALMPSYDLIENAAVRMRERKPGLRPLVDIVEGTHPMAVDQATGISVERLNEVAGAVLHASG